MRTLSFEASDRRYELLYAWLVQGAPLRDRGQAKLHGLVLDKLEAIGQVKPPLDPTTGQPRPYLSDEIRFFATPSGGKVCLEDAEWEVAKERAASAVGVIHPALSREYERIVSWLESLPADPIVKYPAP